MQQLRCTSATDTWCDLAELLTLEELIVVGDGLVGRTAALCTLDDLVEAVGLRAGRSGCGMLRAALARVRPRTDSPRETRLRLLVVDAGLPEPVVNHAVLDRRRRFIGYADLAYPDLRIAIEYEGDHHRHDPAQWERDIRRYEQMERAGWTVVRITAAGIADAAGCVERIERAIAGAARA